MTENVITYSYNVHIEVLRIKQVKLNHNHNSLSRWSLILQCCPMSHWPIYSDMYWDKVENVGWKTSVTEILDLYSYASTLRRSLDIFDVTFNSTRIFFGIESVFKAEANCGLVKIINTLKNVNYLWNINLFFSKYFGWKNLF